MDRNTNPRARTGPSTLAFHVSRIVIDVGVLIVLAAMSMSFVTFADGSRDSVAADALPVLLLLVPLVLTTLLPDHSRPILAPLAWGGMALSLVALPLAVVKYLDAANLASTLGGSVGFGARLLVLGAFVSMAGVALSLAGPMLSQSGGSSGRRPARPAAATPGRSRAAPSRKTAPPSPPQPRPARRGSQPPASGTAPVPRPSGQPRRRSPETGEGR